MRSGLKKFAKLNECLALSQPWFASPLVEEAWNIFFIAIKIQLL
jgi:hypothetical protein